MTILATGECLVGSGTRAFGPVVEELVAGAEREIQIAAYRFDDSAIHLLELVKRAALRGLRVTVVIDNLARQPPEVRRFLRAMEREAASVRLVDFHRSGRGLLHAKVVVVDRSAAIIGSANLTWGGIVGNHEIGVLLEGKEVWQIARLIDLLAATVGC